MAVHKDESKRVGAGISPPCEMCGSSYTTVISKRGDSSYNLGDVYRRRECLDCGSRFTTFEIGMGLYQGVRENHRLRNTGVKMFNDLKNGKSLDRFENLSIIERDSQIAEMWNDPTFTKGIHYGAMLALAQIFRINKGDLQQ